MVIELHPEAKKWVNDRGRELVAVVDRRPPEERRPTKPESSFNHRPVISVDYSKISRATLISSNVDDLGRDLNKYLALPDGPIGLGEAVYPRFRDLVQRLAVREEVRESVSFEFIEKVAFEWIIRTYKNELGDSLADYLTRAANAAVKSQRVLIPISYLHIQSPFRLGNVRFEFLTKLFWDDYESRVRSRFPGAESDFVAFMGEKRKKYQGVVVSSIELTAEEEKAIQIALRETDRALVVLRAFSHSVFVLRIPSYFEKMGHTLVPTTHMIFVGDNGVTIASRQEDQRQIEILIGDAFLEDMRKQGLDAASELISRAPQSELEEALITSIGLLSRGIASANYQERLVFVLASMETILLKDSREPVRAALAQRLAFLSADSPDDRMKVANIVREVYDKRSRYLHHGEAGAPPPDSGELELYRELQFRAWVAISKVLRTSGFTSRVQLADFIEREMFS